MTLRRLFALAVGAMLLLPLTTGIAQAQDDKKALYPNATREEPELDLRSKKVSDKINAGMDALNSGDLAKAREILAPLADSEQTESKYAQALALQGLANIAYQQDNLDKAIAYLQQSLDNGVLPNDTYFQLLFQQAQFYLVDAQYQKALDTLQQWRTEGGNTTADSFGLEGRIQYRLKNYQAAIDALEKAKKMSGQSKPAWDEVLSLSYAESGQGDKAVALAEQQFNAETADEATYRNTVSLLINAGKYPRAIELLEQAQSKGMMSDAKSYINLAKLHMMIGQSAEDAKPEADKAVALLEGAIASGKLESNGAIQMLIADAAYMALDEKKAIAAYQKAADQGAGGNADLRRARLLFNQGRYGEARNAAKAAVEHDAEKIGSAYMLMASAERSLGNKGKAVEAMKMAAKYPETKEQAERWLREAGK